MTTVSVGIASAGKEAGVTYRQLDHYVRQGYLKPAHEGGSGRQREWTRAELDVARVMGRLTAVGLRLETAHRIARSREPRAEIAPGIWIEVTSC